MILTLLFRYFNRKIKREETPQHEEFTSGRYQMSILFRRVLQPFGQSKKMPHSANAKFSFYLWLVEKVHEFLYTLNWIHYTDIYLEKW